MSPNSVILYIFYRATIKQCLAFIADLKINHWGYKEDTEVMVPIVCLCSELEKMHSPPPKLSQLIGTYSIYSNITDLHSFPAQFLSFITTEYWGTLRQGRQGRKREEKRIELGFVFIGRKGLKNASMYWMSTCARHSYPPLISFSQSPTTYRWRNGGRGREIVACSRPHSL